MIKGNNIQICSSLEATCNFSNKPDISKRLFRCVPMFTQGRKKKTQTATIQCFTLNGIYTVLELIFQFKFANSITGYTFLSGSAVA